MKKSLLIGIVLFGFVLIKCGSVAAQDNGATAPGEKYLSKALLPIRPVGQTVRYVIPYFASLGVETTASRAVTAISVYNQTNKDCIVGVHFQAGASTVDSCNITNTIKAGESSGFCTRTVHDSAYPCLAVPTCNPELTGIMGHAFITSNNACSNIAVDAHLIYTSDAQDRWVSGITPLRLIKINKPNLGD